MAKEFQPFSATHDKLFPQRLTELRCSLVLSTYKAGKLIILSMIDGQVTQLPRTFEKPMGMALSGDRMAVATREEVIVLANSTALAPNYPKAPGRYDSLWTPRAVYFNGETDTHDMAFSDDGLLSVNTRFSCLALVDDNFSFRPVWKPPFVTDLQSEDRCHLNGMALKEGKARYVTLLGKSDTPKGWRTQKHGGGLLMDITTDEVVTGGLSMPHSPRVIDGVLYVCNSGQGEILVIDEESGAASTLAKLPGFLRGMSSIGDYLVVGMSLLRDTRSFGGLPIEESDEALMCGVSFVHKKTGDIAGTFRYLSTVEELYDVHVLPGQQRPGILGTGDNAHRDALALPDQGYWAQRDRPEEPQQNQAGWT
ncbi:MAG: TIGR03032 family protein [Halioglobus sp.]|nr:TIGR03032 family protein [Halioglobus sp.]